MTTHTATADTSDRTTKAWKQQLLKAKLHYSKLATALWRWTKTMLAVFDDSEFRADVDKRDDHDAANWIDAEFPGLPFRFLQLRAIYNAFPQEKDWKSCKITDLWAKAREMADITTEPPKRTQNRITQDQYKNVCEERDHWKYRAGYLEREVAKLQARVQELERLLPAEPVAA